MLPGKADPTTIAAAGTITSLSPILGEYAIILLGAVAGALCALSSMDLHGRKGFLYFFRAVTMSAMTASFAAAYLSDLIGHPVQQLLMPAAFIIALVGDNWLGLKDWLLSRITKERAS